MTNEQLAEFIQQGGNDELLPLLWDKTRILIYKKCGQFWRFYSEKLMLYGYSLDDLRQEGYNALVFAVGQYKGGREYKFTTYLNYALKHVIRSLLSGSDVLNQSGTQSLEQPLTEDKDGEQMLVGDVIPDDRATAVFENIERLDEYTALYEAVDGLLHDQRDIIREYYFEGLTNNQIGERHGYSAQRAQQLRDKALRELRKNKRLHALYSEDYGFCHTYRHKSLAAFRSSGTSEIEDYLLWRLGKYSPTNRITTAL